MRSVDDRHLCHMTAKVCIFVDGDHSKLSELYLSPKLHKRPNKSRCIANSSPVFCTLTACLTAIKYREAVYETNDKNLFWSIINSSETLSCAGAILKNPPVC